MKYIVTLNGKQFEVEVERGQATAVYTGEAAASIPSAPVSTTPAASVPTPVISTAAPAGAGEAVSAPMPGSIFAVRCANGQAVKKGDILFILEAMKMENEIFAPRDGTITAVCVSKGTTVETGSTLCTLS